MRSKLTLQQKLLGCCGALVSVALLGAVSAAWTAHRMGTEMDRVSRVASEKVATVAEFSTVMDRIRIAGRQVLVYAFLEKPEIVEQEIGKIETAKPRFDQAVVRLRNLLDSPAERQAFAEAEAVIGPWYRNIETVNTLCRAEKPEEAAASSQKNGRAVSDTFDKVRIGLLESARQELRSSSERAQTARAWSNSITALIVMLTITAGGIILLIVLRMSRQLWRATHDIAASAEGIHTTVSQFSSSSRALAAGASEQAASLEETSSATEEISSISRSNAASAGEASSLVSSVDVRLRDGDRAVNSMIVSMDDVNTSNSKVSKIIKIIDEIAFQTNILALNAAVEAARAGDAGLGFAVVADEVRNLAQRCAQAARDTTHLIEDSLSKAQGGRSSVEQVNAVFREISGNAGKLSAIIRNVSAGSEQQATGMAEIARAVSQMNQNTQNTAAQAEESAAATNEMEAQANTLQHVAESLRGLVE